MSFFIIAWEPTIAIFWIIFAYFFNNIFDFKHIYLYIYIYFFLYNYRIDFVKNIYFYRSSKSDSNEKADGVKTLTKTLAGLSGVYEWIKVKENGRARDYGSSLTNYKVELDTNVEDSWLSAPEPGKGDTIGFWPIATEFPTASANIVPGVKKDSFHPYSPCFCEWRYR